MKDKTPIGRDSPENGDTKRILAEHFGMNAVDLKRIALSDEILSSITPKLAKQYGVLPITRTDDVLTVAIGDPMDFDSLDSLRYILKLKVEGVYANPKELRELINQHYGNKDT